MYSAEVQSRLEALRAQGLSMSDEDARWVVEQMRQGRVSAAAASSASRAKKTPVSGADVLAKLKAALEGGGVPPKS